MSRWAQDPPAAPPLYPGERFTTTLGERRLAWPGCLSYFQKDNRRYYCRVVETEDRTGRNTHGRLVTRAHLTVEVIE